MNEILRKATVKGVYRVAAVMAAVCATSGAALYAKTKPRTAAGEPAGVVAHVPVTAGITRMLLVKQGGNEYLLLGLEASSNVAVVDVSEPAGSRIVEDSKGEMGAPAGELKIVAGAVPALGAPAGQMTAASEPKEVRSFTGVTAYLKDNRGLIYLANGDGLWIVKSKQAAERDAYEDANANYYGGGD